MSFRRHARPMCRSLGVTCVMIAKVSFGVLSNSNCDIAHWQPRLCISRRQLEQAPEKCAAVQHLTVFWLPSFCAVVMVAKQIASGWRTDS